MDNLIDSLKCPVCYIKFSQQHKPHILDCGHSLCSKCLANISNEKCPLCSVPIDTSKEKPINYSLLSVSQEFQVDKNDIQFCFKHLSPFELICITCVVPLCSKCNKWGKHQKHQVKSMSDFMQDIMNDEQAQQNANHALRKARTSKTTKLIRQLQIQTDWLVHLAIYNLLILREEIQSDYTSLEGQVESAYESTCQKLNASSKEDAMIIAKIKNDSSFSPQLKEDDNDKTRLDEQFREQSDMKFLYYQEIFNKTQNQNIELLNHMKKGKSQYLYELSEELVFSNVLKTQLDNKGKNALLVYVDKIQIIDLDGNIQVNIDSKLLKQELNLVNASFFMKEDKVSIISYGKIQLYNYVRDYFGDEIPIFGKIDGSSYSPCRQYAAIYCGSDLQLVNLISMQIIFTNKCCDDIQQIEIQQGGHDFGVLYSNNSYEYFELGLDKSYVEEQKYFLSSSEVALSNNKSNKVETQEVNEVQEMENGSKFKKVDQLYIINEGQNTNQEVSMLEQREVSKYWLSPFDDLLIGVFSNSIYVHDLINKRNIEINGKIGEDIIDIAITKDNLLLLVVTLKQLYIFKKKQFETI